MARLKLVLDWGVIQLPVPVALHPRAEWLERPATGTWSGPDDPDTSAIGLRVLMVEDDPALALMYQARLEKAGYIVTVAGDAAAGLRHLRQGDVDLVFLDIGLPGMDGLSMLQAMRKEAELQATRVVILTNYTEPPMRNRGLSLGALAYLIKSEITPSWLVERIPDWTKS